MLLADRLILPGLHATLASLLRSARHPEQFHVHIILDSVGDEDKSLIRETFDLNARGASLSMVDHVPERPIGGGTLHGNTTVFGKMQIADLLPDVDRCIYLDADLIVTLDLADLMAQIDDRAVLFVVPDVPRRKSLHRDLYRDHELDLDVPEANAGVVGFNLRRWREIDGLGICKGLARQYAGRFKSADQAIFNMGFANHLHWMDAKYNVLLYAGAFAVPVDATDAIYHLVGSPKPWNPLARHFTRHYPLWRHYMQHTALKQYNAWSYTSPGKLLRLSRSYSRLGKVEIKRKIRKLRTGSEQRPSAAPATPRTER